MLVYIVAFNKSAFQISKELYIDITFYIDDKDNDTYFIFNRTCQNTFGESTNFVEAQVLPEEFEICKLQRRVF